MSAGVARQYTGTAGRVENAQVGVFLAYAAPDGSRALIDRELYLPEKRTDDRERCRAAGIGEEVAFATKPQLARQMIGRAVTAGVRFAWVAGEEVYGGNPKLREWLEEEKIPYVMAVACSEMIATAAGARRADGLAALVPAAGWQRLSCADGSKGPRLHDWALIDTASPGHWLLARRSLHPGEKGGLELAFFRCWSPRPVTVPELVAVAGARWAVEAASPRPRTRPAWTTTRSASTAPGTGTPPCRCSPTRSSPSPPAGCGHRPRNRLLPGRTPAANRVKRGPAACGQIFAPPRTYSPPPFITGGNGNQMIPLTIPGSLPSSSTDPVFLPAKSPGPPLGARQPPGSQQCRRAPPRPGAADPSAPCSSSAGGCLPPARRTLVVGGMRPWSPGTLPSSGSMDRWFPAVGTNPPISVSKRPSSCRNLVGAAGFEPVPLACKARSYRSWTPPTVA